MSIKNFTLPTALYQHILQHAQNSDGLEVCGLLAEDQSGVCSVYRIPNISEEPKNSFYMDPSAQIAALRTMRQESEQLCGIYHSHPRSEAIPSDRDQRMAAYPGTAYLIVSLLQTEPEMKAYLFDGDQFQPLNLVIR